MVVPVRVCARGHAWLDRGRAASAAADRIKGLKDIDLNRERKFNVIVVVDAVLAQLTDRNRSRT